MTNARQVLTAEFEFSDEPLEVDKIDGLMDTIRDVAETKEKTLHRADDRVCDYDVYWNGKTDTVRVAAIVPAVSYEVPQEAVNDE